MPKSILPIASLGFASFVLWLTANHLRMLDQVLNESHMPLQTMQEIFTLNPPVLNIFHPDNHRPLKFGTGSSILMISWSVFFGNSIAFTLTSAVQRGASISDFELPELIAFGVLTVAVMAIGRRAIDRPLDNILERLHGSTFEFGWARTPLGSTLFESLCWLASRTRPRSGPGERAKCGLFSGVYPFTPVGYVSDPS